MNGRSSSTFHRTGHGGLLDKYAMGVSALCLAHCLILPLLPSFLFAAFPDAIQAMPGGTGFHAALFALAFPLGLASLGLGWRTGRIGPGIILLGVSGLGLLLAGLAFPHGSAWDAGITSLGGLALIAAHGTNFVRLRRACC